MCVLAGRRLWEDAGGVILRLERVGTCGTVAVSGPGVLAGGHGVCTEDSRSFRVKGMNDQYVKRDHNSGSLIDQLPAVFVVNIPKTHCIKSHLTHWSMICSIFFQCT